MRATLDDAALPHHEDFIHIHDGRQPVRNDQRGAVGGNRMQGRLDFLLSTGIERARGLIKYQHARVLEDGARDGDALLLPARKLEPALAHAGGVASGRVMMKS